MGLKTLTFLQKAEALVAKNHPEANFDVDSIDLTDKPMYDLLAKGDTLGVFQLESSGMQDLMKKLRPDCFDDIVASNALYRPGPMGSGMLDDFIGRKQGHISVKYEFPELKPILEETYGVIVYQEQVQQIAMRLASYTAGSADLLRRAMGKKKVEEMAKQKKMFLEGAEKNGFDLGKSEYLFDLMAKFAGYGFNKSHAAAYSLITCQTAYIKTHYPVEFYAALLSIERENTDKITRYIADAKRHGIEVLPPHINESDTDFTVLNSGKIRFGLGAIKGVGQIAIDNILEARQNKGPFEDMYDLCARTNSRMVNKRVLEAFVKAGVLDCFGAHRASLFAAVDDALAAGASLQKIQDDNQGSFLDLFGGEEDVMNQERTVSYPEKERWSRLEELKLEKQTIGIYVTGHPLDDFDIETKKYTTCTIGEAAESGTSRDVMIAALVTSLRQFITKRGDRMAFATLEDRTGQLDTVIFSDVFIESEEILKSEEPIWVKAKLEVGEGGNKFILSKKGNAQILPLKYAYEELAREIHLHLESTRMPEEKLEKLQQYLQGFGNQEGGGPFFLHLHLDGKATTVLRAKQTVPVRREAVDFIRDIFKEEHGHVEFR